MAFWILLWKVVLIVGLVAFGVLASVVTVLGARDVKHLLATLKSNQNGED
tara:strand:+ start:5 stop:154 length:150 start_codon:yes stop_codon:yes gene_type:complete